MNEGVFKPIGGVSENEEVMQYCMCPYCHKHVPSAEVISHLQTIHKREPEPRIQYANPQMIPIPRPPFGLAPPSLAQVQPLLQYANPQMMPPSFRIVLAQEPPRIQSTNAHMKPTPPLHGSAPNATTQEQPCIQYATPLYGLAPNPEQMVVRSSGESSSRKIMSNNNSARFRYRPYPRHEKPNHVPPPFDLNVVYLGIPLSMERTGTGTGTGPPVLDARRENMSVGDGPPVSDAQRENRPVGDGMADIRGSSTVRQPVIAIFSGFFKGNFMGWCSHPNGFSVQSDFEI